MPYVASLPKDRFESPMACCRGKAHLWDSLEYQQKVEICKDCPLRLRGETSCNGDFITITNAEILREDIVKIVNWILKDNPPWTVLDRAFSESMAVLGATPTNARQILLDYIKTCKPANRDQDFWRDWNRMVEYYEGKKVSPVPWDTPGNIVVNDLIAPQIREGAQLDAFYCAANVIWAAAEYLGYAGVRKSFDILADACYRARLAHIPMEVS